MAIRYLVAFALAASASLACAQAQTAAPASSSRPSVPRVVGIDRVVAVVNDEAVTQYDVNDAKQAVLQQLKQQKVQPPSSDVLEKQVLERLITERSLMQVAKENGVKVDDTQIERAIARIAQDNKLTPDELRKELEKQGVPFAKYRDDVRNEIIMQRLREREVDNKITVSDAEVDQYLATMKAQNGG